MINPNQRNPYKERILQSTCINEELPYKERSSPPRNEGQLYTTKKPPQTLQKLRYAQFTQVLAL